MSAANHELVEAVRALARISRILERASGELSLAHYRVLAAVDAGDERASRIAARLALGRPTVSAAVDSLAQRGLLTRVVADDDQRAAVLSLTDDGRALLGEVETQMIDRLEGLCARTPDGDQLVESLVWLGAALDEAFAERVPTKARATR